LKRLSLFALAIAGAALAQAPAPAPAQTPAKTLPPCPTTAGLEIGQPREAAFEMMRKKSPDLKTTNVKTYHHAPADRPYEVDVTFASEAADAKVTRLHYLFQPAGVLDALRERWGEPSDKSGAVSYVWRVDRCGVLLAYAGKLDEMGQISSEELTVEALPVKK
jgi:hypothetical protein